MTYLILFVAPIFFSLIDIAVPCESCLNVIFCVSLFFLVSCYHYHVLFLLSTSTTTAYVVVLVVYAESFIVVCYISYFGLGIYKNLYLLKLKQCYCIFAKVVNLRIYNFVFFVEFGYHVLLQEFSFHFLAPSMHFILLSFFFSFACVIFLSLLMSYVVMLFFSFPFFFLFFFLLLLLFLGADLSLIFP